MTNITLSGDEAFVCLSAISTVISRKESSLRNFENKLIKATQAGEVRLYAMRNGKYKRQDYINNLKELHTTLKLKLETTTLCDHYYPRGDDGRLNPCEFCGEVKPIAKYEIAE